jgi:hypothetical protein
MTLVLGISPQVAEAFAGISKPDRGLTRDKIIRYMRREKLRAHTFGEMVELLELDPKRAFRNANLEGEWIDGIKSLEGWDFSGAHLARTIWPKGTSLAGVNFSGANLHNAVMCEKELARAILSPSTRMPCGRCAF